MKAKYSYEYPRPAVAVDCAIFGFDGSGLHLLVIERDNEPLKGKWALPGGFVHTEETAEEAARRVLQEKVGVKNVFVEQLYTFSEIDRDPRDRVISISYYALVNSRQYKLIAGKDTVKAEWFPVSSLPKLAFDHDKITKMALQRLKGKVRYQPIGFELLNEKFTLTELQQLYEAILETTIDKRNFRKKILGMELLEPLEERQKNVAHKAARYYRFDKKAYRELTRTGFNFEL